MPNYSMILFAEIACGSMPYYIVSFQVISHWVSTTIYLQWAGEAAGHAFNARLVNDIPYDRSIENLMVSIFLYISHEELLIAHSG